VTAENQPQLPVHVELLLGAYVLGALTPDEDRQVARHLRSCARCGAAYVDLAEAPWLLGMLSEADLRTEPRTEPGEGPCAP
jgi:anti-sigma factor RsiW